MKATGFIGVIKRVLPFFATFALGLLIASFFVDIGRPSFRGNRSGKHKEMRRLKTENQELKQENLRLRNQLESQNWHSEHRYEEWNRPPLDHLSIPPPVPVTPVAPRAR